MNPSQTKGKILKGFTLIELLVVIAIIGLLASVVLLALNGARAKSRDAKRIADVRQMASAFELFYNEYFSYPTNASMLYLTPTFIGAIPGNPSPNDGTCATTNPNGYVYTPSSTNASVYALSFCLGNKTGTYNAGPHTLTQSGVQ